MKVSEIQAAVIIVFLKVTSVDADNKAYTKDLEFEYFDKWMDWEFARHICQERGGDLVMVKSDLIAEAISKIVRDETSWIGATDTSHEGSWKWVDGTSVMNSLKDWANGEPNGATSTWLTDEDCAAINTKGKWVDVACTGSERHYICQKYRSTTETFGNHVFVYNRTAKVTYNEAKEACKNINSRLVEIHQKDVDDAVRKHIRTNISMYCGGRDELNNKTVMWASGKKSGYHNWLGGAPNSQIKQCIVVKTNGWKDVECTAKRYYICEMIYVNNLIISPKQVTLKNKIENVQVTCEAEGIPFPLVEWQGIPKSHRLIQRPQTGKSILDVSGATIDDEGTYTCNAQNTVNGSEASIKGDLFLKVIATPKDVEVNPVHCSSSLTVTWQANERAVNAQHEIAIFNSNGDRLNIYKAAANKATTQHTFTNLASWTIYEIRVTPCVTSNCKYNYTETSSATSHGKPGTVVGLNFLKSGQYSCSTSWNHPTAVQTGYITGFVITVQETFNVIAPELNSINKTSTSVIQKAERTYNLSGNPNRIYRVGVQARTCAGLGKIEWSKNSCVTDAKEPDKVEKVILSSSQINAKGTIEIQVPVPEQDNGLISCLYVIVNAEAEEAEMDLGLPYTLNDLIEANNSLSKETPKEYIAIAYNLSSMSGNTLYLELGNGNLTECDAKAEATNTQVMTSLDVNGSRFVGQNFKMRQKKRYRIVVVTATPTSSRILLQTSGSTLIGVQEPQKGASVVAPIVISLVIALALIILAAMWWKKRSTQNQPKSENESPYAGITPETRQENITGMSSGDIHSNGTQLEDKKQNSSTHQSIDKDSSNYCTIDDRKHYGASTTSPDNDLYEIYVKALEDSNQYESIDQVAKNRLQDHFSFTDSGHYEICAKTIRDCNQYEQLDAVTELSELDGPYEL